jgi:Cu2+-exporting ATPase
MEPVIKLEEQTSINRKSGLVKEAFPVTGMSCAACAGSVETILKSVGGVKDAAVNFATQTAWAEYDQKVVGIGALKEALQKIGYDLIYNEKDPVQLQEEIQRNYYTRLKQQTVWAAILTLPIVLLGMFFSAWAPGTWISMFLTGIVLFGFGNRFFVSAWRRARKGMANMDTLVALSTGIAFLFSVFNTFYPDFWLKQGLHPTFTTKRRR